VISESSAFLFPLLLSLGVLGVFEVVGVFVMVAAGSGEVNVKKGGIGGNTGTDDGDLGSVTDARRDVDGAMAFFSLEVIIIGGL